MSSIFTYIIPIYLHRYIKYRTQFISKIITQKSIEISTFFLCPYIIESYLNHIVYY